MQTHPPSSIFHPRRILVRGVNWLGDAVMTTPALARLRERFPDAHISLLTHEKIRDLWLHLPVVNETISFGPGEGLLSVSRKLRAGKFDLALVLPNSPRSALEVYLAGIPKRIGYARPWRNLFLTQSTPLRPGRARMHKRSVQEIETLVTMGDPASRIPHPASVHQIHDYLHLVAALGASREPLPPRLFVTTHEIAVTARKFGLDGAATKGRPILGLNPGAEYGAAKRWPVERFIAAAQEIQKRTGCTVLILGGKGDVPIASQIESGLRLPVSAFRPLVGQTSLRELMALLKMCGVVLSNDSGPMHVSAALGTPVVVPFGSTSPELTGPGLPGDSRHQLLKSDAPCSPCFLRKCPIDFRCMNGISVERIVEATLQALGARHK
jgi:heptosyltransferase II